MWSIELSGDGDAYHAKTVHETLDGALQAANEEEDEVEFTVDRILIVALTPPAAPAQGPETGSS